MSNYLTPEDIAIRLGVHPKSVREWCRMGKLKAIKAGKLWRIAPEDLMLFIQPTRGPKKSKG